MKRYDLDGYDAGMLEYEGGDYVYYEDAARILAQRDRLAELLREVEVGLDMFGGFPCTCRKIKEALAELDKEKKS